MIFLPWARLISRKSVTNRSASEADSILMSIIFGSRTRVFLQSISFELQKKSHSESLIAQESLFGFSVFVKFLLSVARPLSFATERRLILLFFSSFHRGRRQQQPGFGWRAPLDWTREREGESTLSFGTKGTAAAKENPKCFWALSWQCKLDGGN